MLKYSLKTLDKKKLRRWLLLFFVALLVPTAVLIQQSYSRLKWEAFHQHQQMAQELSARIDNRFAQLIRKEDQRPFTDYAFLNVAGDVQVGFLQRSPLSEFPVAAELPGLMGYFQVDNAGQLITPLVPEADASQYGISTQELSQRLALQNQIQDILATNQLLQKPVPADVDDAPGDDISSTSFVSGKASPKLAPPDAESAIAKELIPAPSPQAARSPAGASKQYAAEPQLAFDQLKSLSKAAPQQSDFGRLEDLNIQQNYQQVAPLADKPDELQGSSQAVQQARQFKAAPEKRARVEQNSLPESQALPPLSDTSPAATPSPRIMTFESEIDTFEFSQLASGHFVLYRKVWLNGQKLVQGLLIEPKAFLSSVIDAEFRATALSQMSDLLVAYQGNILTAFSGRSSRGYLSSSEQFSSEQLYKTKLSAPLSDIQLLYSVTQLPVGPGGQVIIWLAAILGFVLCGGFYLLYRLGLGQINLANQQQDFVSAVSHELKTPLTSIRMYGELLREGWASEEKKRSYYDFIFDESERLSRLINNVLQLARMTRNEQGAELQLMEVSQLLRIIESKVSSQIERAGFELKVSAHESIDDATLMVDPDWLTQIMINLVDNAIKFSARAERKLICISAQAIKDGAIQFAVRDFGPGIEKAQIKKIFQLFYRTESELTRETVGTGIGLSLVQQMASNMQGKVSVSNCEPGAAFRLTFAARSN